MKLIYLKYLANRSYSIFYDKNEFKRSLIFIANNIIIRLIINKKDFITGCIIMTVDQFNDNYQPLNPINGIDKIDRDKAIFLNLKDRNICKK